MSNILGSLGLPAEILDLYSKYAVLITLAAIVVLGILAFFGYKIFKVVLTLGCSVGLGFVSHMFLSEIIMNAVGDALPSFIDPTIIVALLFALLGAVLSIVAYKLVVLALGAGVGYLLGGTITQVIVSLAPDVAFLNSSACVIVVSALAALIGAILFGFLFKLIYILATSVGGMAAAGVLAATLIVPAAGLPVIIGGAVAGGVFGIIPLVYQAKKNQKYKSIRYYY